MKYPTSAFLGLFAFGCAVVFGFSPATKSGNVTVIEQQALSNLFRQVTPKPDMNKFREPPKVEWEI